MALSGGTSRSIWFRKWRAGSESGGLVQKVEEFLVAVTGGILADDFAAPHVERSKQGRCAMPLVVMRHGRAAPLLQGQAGLGAVKRLYLRLFIDRQHHRMGGRGHIKPAHVAQLFGKSRIGGQLERAPAVRGQAMCLPCRARSGPPARQLSPSRAKSSVSRPATAALA